MYHDKIRLRRLRYFQGFMNEKHATTAQERHFRTYSTKRDKVLYNDLFPRWYKFQLV